MCFLEPHEMESVWDPYLGPIERKLVGIAITKKYAPISISNIWIPSSESAVN